MVNFFIKTYGCQANVADSQAVSNYLTDMGCFLVDTEAKADLILINTCAIRDKAEQKMFSYLGRLDKFVKTRPYLKVGVIGCIASYKKDYLRSNYSYVSFVFGAKQDLALLKEILSDIVLKLETIKQISLQENSGKGQEENFNLNDKLNLTNFNLSLGGFKNKTKELKQSFVNIMTGCNNYCSYCIVPFTRGREKSFSSSSILSRIELDVANGAKEITLLGQNVNSYKDPETGMNFAQLLESVANISGEFWVRFVSPHPKDMTLDVLDIMAKYNTKLCSYMHLPLQSGSNQILQDMNRTYTVEQYLELVDKIKEKLPNVAISTDIIVGFPGETEKDYMKTREILEIVKYDLIYSFIYSPRKYTKAILLQDNIDQAEKLKRLEELQKRQIEISLEKNSLNIGRSLKTLVEKRLTNGKLLARTEGNLRVIFDGPDDLIGTFVLVKIEKITTANLLGSLTK